MRLSLRQLDTFRAFARTLSVTETARATYVSQSAVSHTLHDMERELGLKLFFRLGNRLRLTAEGRALLPEIERVFAQLSRLEGQAATIRDQGGGQLAVAGLSSISGWLISEAAGRFLTARPKLRFSLRNLTATEVVDHVRTETADIGFSTARGDDAGVVLEPLLKAEVMCALPPGHPLAGCAVIEPGQLETDRLIVPSRYTVVGTSLTEAFTSERLRRPDVLEINQTSLSLDFVERGLGVALIHPFGYPFGRRNVVLRRFLPTCDLRMMMVFSRNRPLSPLIGSFVREVRAVAAAMTEGCAARGLPLELD